jgi:hypothetical protein
VSTASASAPATKSSFSAPSRAAAAVGTGTSSCAARRGSLPRHLAAATAAEAGAAPSGPSADPSPLSAEDEAERAKLAQVPFTRSLLGFVLPG